MNALIRTAGMVVGFAALFMAAPQAVQGMDGTNRLGAPTWSGAHSAAGGATNALLPQSAATPGAGVQWWHPVSSAVSQSSGAAAQVIITDPALQAAVQRLQETAEGGVQVTFRRNGTPIEIKGPLLARQFAGALVAGATRHQETARGFLRQHHVLVGLDDPDRELQLRKSERDDLGRQHLRFRQVYQGLPVWPCEVLVHLNANGELDLLNGAFIPTPAGVATKPTVSAEQAVRNARTQVAQDLPATSDTPELIVYGPLDKPPRLAWKFDLTAGLDQSWRCVVDALDGSVLLQFTLVNEGAVTGSGKDGLGTTRALHLWQQGTTYYMVDTSKAMYDATSTPPSPDTTRGAVFVWDCKNTPPTNNPSTLGSPVQSTSTSATSWSVPDAVSAAYGLSEVYDYYLARHGRNSLDGVGGSITAYVRVGINFRNAFWTGSLKVMIFGDTLPSGLDVCGHELTHGVINSVGDGGILNYHDQPGALNEGFADIFGENVVNRTQGANDWKMAGDTVLGVIRNLADPNSLTVPGLGEPYPANMNQFLNLSSTQDSGGVHENSCIFGHCYYLLAAGMPGAIGMSNAASIFYRAMTLHLAKESQFIDARHACVTSAQEIYGTNSVQATQTAAAFDAVGIVDAPSSPPPTGIPVVQGADSALYLRGDPFSYEYDLFRREAAQGDSVAGTFVGTVDYLSHQRVSVSGDGSYAVYVTANNDFGTVLTDGGGAQLAGFPGTVYSVAMAPDGSRVAYVPLNFFGYAMNAISVYDFATGTTKTIKVYAVDSEGRLQDIIQYPEVLNFTADGQTLYYDAYAEASRGGTNVVSGWAIYRLDLATTNFTMLTTLGSRFDIGNPSLGKARNNLMTFEVRDNSTGLSGVYAVDLAGTNFAQVAQLTTPDALAKPTYTGDESAVVYARPDGSTFTGYSLYRQALAADGVTPAGAPALWLSDADVATIYRRGTFVPSTALPTVALVSPTDGQTFNPGATIALQATASDVGGTVAKVQFYAGSALLGESATAPYTLNWPNVPAGQYSLTARAINTVGGSGDSAPVKITVSATGSRPTLQNVTRLTGGGFQFTVSGNAGQTFVVETSTDLVHWSQASNVANNGTVTITGASMSHDTRRFFRARQP